MSSNLEMEQVVAVVLAGGFGTRIQHLLRGVPKPMAEVAGKPFLEWVVRYLAKQGISRVVISTGHLAEVVEQHFEKRPVENVTTVCIRENTPLGTGGGLLHAVRSSGWKSATWLGLNGDSLAFVDLKSASTRLSNQNLSGVIFGRPVPDASRYGTLAMSPGNELLGFEEKRPGVGVINSGLYLLRESLFRRFPDRQPLSLEKDVFPSLIAEKVRLAVEVADVPFLDIGTPDSLPLAESFVQQNAKYFA